MNVNAVGALSSYTYQSTLAQTGSAGQALSQALAASKAQVDQASSIFGNTGQGDALTALTASSGLSALSYSASAASGSTSDVLQALLGTSSSSSASTSSLSSLFSTSGGQSVSAAMLSPDATAALARYTYNQSQTSASPTATTSSSSATPTITQLIASGQQALLSSTLNLLA